MSSGIEGKIARLEIKAAASVYAELALLTLVNIMRKGETDRDRLGAAKEILDRAYGKAVQAHQLASVPDDAAGEETINNAERFTSAIVGLATRSSKKRADPVSKPN